MVRGNVAYFRFFVKSVHANLLKNGVIFDAGGKIY